MLSDKKYDEEIKEVLDHLRSIGGPVPLHRKESKRPYSFSKWPFAEQLAVWDMLWRNQGGFWIRVHAFFFLERHMKKEAQLREMWPVIVGWQNKVDDWGLCDSLSKIYTRILEIMPVEVYAQLQLWNTGPDLWKRRQSLVSLLYYSRTKKSYLPYDKLEPLILPLLTDKEYYVQKGVGWTLRELHNVYPAEALSFFKAHVKTLSSIHFSTAIEKLGAETVTELKAMRKSGT
jgi:3-methyladenine DNA glycosylase AlkD